MSRLRLVVFSALLMLGNCGPVRIGRDSVALPARADARSTSPETLPERSTRVEEAAYGSSGAPHFTCSAGAITCLHVDGQGAGNGVAPGTIGIPFAPGQVARGASVPVTVRGQTVAAQMDQPGTYPDGSLRFAIVSLALPASATGSVVSLGGGGPAVNRPGG